LPPSEASHATTDAESANTSSDDKQANKNGYGRVGRVEHSLPRIRIVIYVGSFEDLYGGIVQICKRTIEDREHASFVKILSVTSRIKVGYGVEDSLKTFAIFFFDATHLATSA